LSKSTRVAEEERKGDGKREEKREKETLRNEVEKVE
jgi:hypothetical protein